MGKKSRWDREAYATYVLGPLEAASVQPVWFLYGLKRYTSTMIKIKYSKIKEIKNYLIVDQKIWNGEKEHKQTYHVHKQNKIILSGTSGKVEYYNNTCYIVILFHPP